jgi:hypothetical protein
MPASEFPENLLGRNAFAAPKRGQTLPNALDRLEPIDEIEESLVGGCVLDDEFGAPVDCEHDGPMRMEPHGTPLAFIRRTRSAV